MEHTDHHRPRTVHQPDPPSVLRAIERRHVAVVASVSPAGRPHAATVVYQMAGDRLWFSTERASRKARNIAAHPNVAVTIHVRRAPVGPPSTIQFQSTATLVDCADDDLRRLAAAGRLRAVTSHGELDLPGGCFVRIDLPARVHTYGLGMSLWQLVRNPLDAAGGATVRPELAHPEPRPPREQGLPCLGHVTASGPGPG